jgi:hypothetical protein
VWPGCCFKMANFLSVACCVSNSFPSHTHIDTVVTTWFPWNVELLGGVLYLGARAAFPSLCFSSAKRHTSWNRIRCVLQTTLWKQLGHKKTVKVCLHVVASHPSSPHCRQLFNSL